MAEMLRTALAVLSDPAVPGSEKRAALSPIVERVICRKGGADVVFAPGLFDEHWGQAEGLWGGANVMGQSNLRSGEIGARSTCQTTCTVIQFRSGIFTYEKRVQAA